MPYADKSRRADVARGYREKMKDDSDFLQKETERKALWYHQNKARKNDSQRRWRQEKREQLIADLVK